MFNLENYIKSRKGKRIDIDHAYGAQCWDGFADYCIENKLPVFTCPLTGFVIDIWNNRKNNGLLKYFDVVQYQDARRGDWIIWNPCTNYPNSHIAMIYEKTPLIIFGQNQTPTQEFCTIKGFAYSNTIACVLRIKQNYQQKFTKSGYVEALYDQIRIRKQPNLEKESDTGYVYNKGMKLYYDSLVDRNGYIWACYTSRSGNRRYIALTDSQNKKPFFKQI